MGILNFWKKKEQPKQVEKQISHGRNAGGEPSHRFYNGGGSVKSLINQCFPDARPDVSPRVILDEIRTVNWAFTPFTTAADRHTELMGRAMVESEDKKLEQELQDLADDFNVITNNRADARPKKGLSTAASLLRKWSYLDGSAFLEVQEDDAGILNNLRVYDSERFDIQRVQTFLDRLTFIQDNGALIYVPDTMNLIEFMPDIAPGKPWGIPLSYNATFMVDALTRLLVNQRHQRDRVSSPPGFAYLTVDPTFLQKLPDHERKDMMDQIKGVTDNLKDMFGKAFHGMRSVGEQYYEVGVLPGGAGVAEKTFGADIPIMGDFDGEFDRTAKLAFLPTKMPFQFLGIETSGGGLGSDEYKTQMSLMMNTATENRYAVGIEAKRILDMKMDSMRMNPRMKDRYTIRFDAPNIEDMEAKANNLKTTQEALSIGINNYMLLKETTGKSPAAATRIAAAYAERYDLEFLT